MIRTITERETDLEAQIAMQGIVLRKVTEAITKNSVSMAMKGTS